jgi:hypothetical protein
LLVDETPSYHRRGTKEPPSSQLTDSAISGTFPRVAGASVQLNYCTLRTSEVFWRWVQIADPSCGRGGGQASIANNFRWLRGTFGGVFSPLANPRIARRTPPADRGDCHPTGRS